jgi:NAD-dependent SIR2 family protein deacetylase
MWIYVVWGILLLLIVGMLIRMRSLFSIYRCPKCGNEFKLKPLAEFFFPQIMYKKITKCPNCKKIVSATVIRNQENIDRLEKMTQPARKEKNKSAKKRKEPNAK